MNQAILQTMKRTAFAALGLAALAAPADAKGLKQRLDATGVLPEARGEIKLVLQKATSGRFEIKVKKLAPSASYELHVGAVKVATLQTNPRGDGKLRFRSTPKSSRDQLLGFDPRGARVALRGSDGADVLEGEVVQPPGEELSAGKIICCEPDDDRTECEDRTPDECVARGGAVTAATSCLPNPCADAPDAPRETVCCEPDDSGPECEDRTPAECAARGGVSVEATSCASNPCGGQTLPPGGDDDGGNGGGTDDPPGMMALNGRPPAMPCAKSSP